MTASDLASIISGVAPVVREYVAGAISSFGDRLQALEQRMLSVRDGKDGIGIQGEPGQNGKDAEPVDIDALVLRVAALVPAPVNGRDGANGKDADDSLIAELKSEIAAVRAELAVWGGLTPSDVKAILEDRIAAMPAAKDGADGVSVDPADVEAMVAKAVAAIPPPQHGQDGRSLTVDDVAPLIASEVQKAVGALPEPQDGVGVVGALIDRSGHLVVTLSDGTVKDVGPVVGGDGAPGVAGRDGVDGVGRDGIDGKDGLGFDDMVIEHDGDRGILVKLIQGERVKTFGPFVFPVLVYKGVWKAGETYQQGETVTWGGSMWHANKSTSAKPGDGGGDWTLSVKKGSDGGGGKPGPQGERGPRGEAGPMGPARY